MAIFSEDLFVSIAHARSKSKKGSFDCFAMRVWGDRCAHAQTTIHRTRRPIRVRTARTRQHRIQIIEHKVQSTRRYALRRREIDEELNNEKK